MAGTVVESIVKYGVEHGVAEKVLAKFTCVGDADDGTIPDTAFSATLMSLIRGMFLYLMVTVPGDTAPTASYDITVVNADALDILGGAGADRSASAAEQVMPIISSTAQKRLVTDDLTLKIANQAVHSADIVVQLLFTRN